MDVFLLLSVSLVVGFLAWGAIKTLKEYVLRKFFFGNDILANGMITFVHLFSLSVAFYYTYLALVSSHYYIFTALPLYVVGILLIPDIYAPIRNEIIDAFPLLWMVAYLFICVLSFLPVAFIVSVMNYALTLLHII